MNEGQEIPPTKLGDDSREIGAVESFTQTVPITRQAIVNDDLNEITVTARESGRAASRLIGNLVFDILINNPLLSDGIAFFDIGHGNVGTAATISIDPLDELRGLMGSHIENSPNSVAEAQTIGAPCIATSFGGTTSMVTDEISGLLYTAGDTAALVNCIDRVFSDDNLALSLSTGERELAKQRGNDSTNINTLIDIYGQVLDDHKA